MKFRKQSMIPVISCCMVILCGGIFYYLDSRDDSMETHSVVKPTASAIPATPTPAPTPEDLSHYSFSEDAIYSYFQGPKAWKSKKTWSGSWADMIFEGNSFGNFGCGLCCMANIYSTLSDYVCSPVDMYHFAVENSSYAPSYGYGAISWPAIASTLEICGIESQLHRKTDDYSTFQQDIAHAYATIVLISSYDSDVYWQNTGGHYVTIWNYDETDDTIFLTDSGNPEHNRSHIDLNIIYDSLKTSSSFQYLTANNYVEEQNQWQWNQISEEWVAP